MKHATGWKDNNPDDGADATSILDSEGAQRGSTRMNTANLRKLLDEATPRPWVHEDGSYWIRDPAQPKYVGLVECHDSAMNAALIVELVNSADELLAENERLRAALSDAIDCVDDWGMYASDYFKEKYDLEGDLARLKAALEQKA